MTGYNIHTPEHVNRDLEVLQAQALIYNRTGTVTM